MPKNSRCEPAYSVGFFVGKSGLGKKLTVLICSVDMDVDSLEGLQHLQGLVEDEDFDPNNSNTPNMVNMGGVLNGSERIELSHAGGELGSLEEDLEEDTDDESSEAKTR